MSAKKTALTDLVYEARALMAAKKYNPVEALIEMAQDDTIVDDEIKLKVHKELIKYHTPALGALNTDQEAKSSGNIYVEIANFNSLSLPAAGDSLKQTMKQLNASAESG